MNILSLNSDQIWQPIDIFLSVHYCALNSKAYTKELNNKSFSILQFDYLDNLDKYRLAKLLLGETITQACQNNVELTAPLWLLAREVGASCILCYNSTCTVIILGLCCHIVCVCQWTASVLPYLLFNVLRLPNLLTK